MTDPVRLGPWHQACADAYGARHAGPGGKPIGVAFALGSLYLVLERGFTGIQAREAHGYLAGTVSWWPRFDPPEAVGDVTGLDVAVAEDGHGERVRRWGVAWDAWRHVHAEVAALTGRQLRGRRPRAERD